MKNQLIYFAIFCIVSTSPGLSVPKAKIDLPRKLPSPFGIELGATFQPTESDLLIAEDEVFEIYQVKPPNPVLELLTYRVYVSKRYGLVSLIYAGFKGETPIVIGNLKETLTKTYGAPRLPTREEFMVYDYALEFASLKYYDLKYYWQNDGWHIIIFGKTRSHMNLIFAVDRLLERSFKFAPKP